MKNKLKLYILPGWGDRVTDPNYQRIIKHASKKYDFVPLKVATRNRKYAFGSDKSIYEILDNIEKQIIKPCSEDILLGFSVGALEAFLISRKLKFGKLILCSMSPILGKDILLYNKNEIKDISLQQYKELQKIGYMKIKSKSVVLFYGSKEHEFVKNRSKVLGKRNGYKAIEIEGATHDLNEVYFNVLKKFL